MQNIKGLWRRSLRADTSPSIMGNDAAHTTDPITLAIIGCGQRGQVRVVEFPYDCLVEHKLMISALIAGVLGLCTGRTISLQGRSYR